MTPSPDRAGGAADAVVRLAHRIWDEKAVGLLYAHCAPSVVAHQAGADHYGPEHLVASAVQRLAAFPDLRLHGDEVIGTPDLDGAFVSHRVTAAAHHHGHGAYGLPTGRRVQWREITQYAVRDGRIHDVWYAHDELAVVRRLGLDEWTLARARAQAAAERGEAPVVPGGAGAAGPVERVPAEPGGGPHHPQALPGLIYDLIWNARMLNVTAQVYAPDAVIRVPGARRLQGPAALTAWVLQRLAAFPDGVMRLEHLAWTGNADTNARAAARWTFQGTHTGAGAYGPPTGRRVRMTGLSHFDLQGGRVAREDTLWNELDLLTQLCWPSP
ncbi:ester cyclase (plasmid) [Deinococcus taeanensis]|uniref:ester cyclase n=1 Tax=Deinococcus taeanensis TaxID=2737050 RepID=UPI001CDBF4D0|nr:ester cyclase [Deinococcus taeanensis]UBV44360.1 ester cyclase [Deinococcus taeanensis]